jgi:citrate lyase subunit beta/citryl-CoA lyase
MTRFRSLLFVPGNRADMLAKAENVAADVVLPDMEDSVPDAEKDEARSTIAACLPRLAERSPLVVPRVNALATGLIEQDLEAVVGPHIYGISVGKVDDAGDLSTVSNLIGKLERRAGLEPGRLKLIPWIETAKAIVNCYAICTASPRIVGAAFGGEDYTHDLGIERLDDDAQLLYARSALCTAARAAGVAALDTPYFKFRDLDGLRASSIAAKHLGFKGRFAIHPAQIATINECFSPSAAEIERARRVVAAFEAAERQGRASTSLDGRVIDVPVVKRARALLESLVVGAASRRE